MKISMSLGRTINLGNFESCRIDIGLERDVPDNQFEKESEILYQGLLTEIKKRERQLNIEYSNKR